MMLSRCTTRQGIIGLGASFAKKRENALAGQGSRLVSGTPDHSTGDMAGLSICSDVCHLKRSGNRDAAADGAGDRAVIGMESQDPFGHFAFSRFDLQVVVDMDAPDHQHFAIQFNLACCL
jgi:hypothetical protein